MWEHAATQANVRALEARGVDRIGPEAGELAEGEVGFGRMSEPEEIFARCAERLKKAESLRGRRILVSAGGTREPLDAVRFLGNRSSGRMGVALAAEARARGAEVTLLAANLAVPAPGGVDIVTTPTAADLLREALARADADAVLMAAAVADYRPIEQMPEKRGKDSRGWTLELEPTVDVVRELAGQKNGSVVVAFGAELGEAGLERKRAMLEDKDVDLVVFNDVSRTDVGFDTEENEVVLISRLGERRVPKAPKRKIAAAILDEVSLLLR
jgi:phosphopantothenoylcysteine decarboxylase/phosphopantothenate--cysteine ligase